MAKKRKEGFLQFRCDYALQTKVEDLADSMNKEMGELLREIVSRSSRRATLSTKRRRT
jgi:hypothetical protein